MLSCIPEGACACGAEGRMVSIGPVGPRSQGLCSLRSGGKGRGGRLLVYRRRQYYKTIQPPCGRGNAPLLVAGATTFPPAGGLYSSLCVSFILPPLAGEVWRSRIGGMASAASQSAECLLCPMTQKGKSRNADFILIARKGDTTTLGAKGRQT